MDQKTAINEMAERVVAEQLGSATIKAIRLQTALQFVQSENNALQKQVENLKARVSEQEEELESLKIKLDGLQSRPNSSGKRAQRKTTSS